MNADRDVRAIYKRTVCRMYFRHLAICHAVLGIIAWIDLVARCAHFHICFRSTFMYMYPFPSSLDHAQQCVSTSSLDHHRPIVQLPNSYTISSCNYVEHASRCWHSKANSANICQSLAWTPQPVEHSSHVRPTRPHIINAPATAHWLSPHIIHAPSTSPRLSFNDTCARYTASVSIRWARVGSRVATAVIVRDRTRRVVVATGIVARLLARCGN
jgi:hypothetical protein